jgi:hypothetical protein
MQAELQIRSWILNSLGAMHYYGDLYIDGDHIEINRILDKKTARLINKQERDSAKITGFKPEWCGKYKEGDSTTRFDSLEDIIAELSKFIERNQLSVTEVLYVDKRDVEKIVWTYQQESGTPH